MALTEKLTNIAEAIRVKTGKTTLMKLEDMPSEIASIETGSNQTILLANYEDYTRKEAMRIANKIRNSGVLKNESIVSVCMSDSHYYNSTQQTNPTSQISGKRAIEGIKALTYLLPIDFIAHLGDLGNEDLYGGGNTLEELQLSSDEMLQFLKEAAGDLPLFVAIGNHDPGVYIDRDNDVSDQFSGITLYNKFTSLAKPAPSAVSGEEVGGYCYKDFPKKSLRVYLLNTAEGIITGGYDNDTGASVTQRKWLAESLIALNADSKTSNWSFIVLCHYPMDYGASLWLANLFKAYSDKTTYKDPVSKETFDFSATTAKFLIQIHGHLHNFLTGQICYGERISDRINGDHQNESGLYRLCVPNTETYPDRHNHNIGAKDESSQSTDGYLWGVKFFEGSFDDPIRYLKTAKTAQDTSFVVNIINPSDEMVYSYTYGAGPSGDLDPRRIYIGSGTQYDVSITGKTEAFESVALPPAIFGKSFEVQLTPKAGWVINGVTVTMGGNSIEAWDKETNTVTISNVSGDIVITVDATVIKYEISVNNDGNVIIEGSNGSFTKEVAHGTKYSIKLEPKSGYGINKPTVTMSGIDISTEAWNEGTTTITISSVTGPVEISVTAAPVVYTIGQGTGSHYSLVKETSDNTLGGNVENNSEFKFRVKADSEDGAVYRLSTVSVTVGGSVPSTDNVSYVYDAARQYCTVTLKNINGNVLVNAVGQNLLYEATDENGNDYNSLNANEPYSNSGSAIDGYITPNGKWFREGYRVRSSVGNYVTATSGGYITGYIPHDKTSTKTLYIYNVGLSNYAYSDSMAVGYLQKAPLKPNGQSAPFDDCAKINDGSQAIGIKLTSESWNANHYYIRLTSSLITDNTVIIEVDE